MQYFILIHFINLTFLNLQQKHLIKNVMLHQHRVVGSTKQSVTIQENTIEVLLIQQLLLLISNLR